MTTQSSTWRVWDAIPDYGDVLYKRSTGQAPEMESSKATAKQLMGTLQAEHNVLDVGCGTGHYLVSLRKQFSFPFTYTGADATAHYVELGQQAFAGDESVTFQQADIFDLPFADQQFDVTLCCNVLLHLPAILKPMQELWRVTKKCLVVRTLIGRTSFRIRQVREWREEHAEQEQQLIAEGQDPLFDAEGEPRHFHFFNIYSERYVEWLCSTLPGVERSELLPDTDFDPAALGKDTWPDSRKPGDLTETLAGLQVNGYIVQPWCFLKLWRS